MLDKKSKAVMKVVYNECMKNDGKCIVKPVEILQAIPYKLDFRENELAPVIQGLALEDYYDIVESEKNDNEVYCITLHHKGRAFIRELMSEQRAIKFKITLTLAGTIGAFILGRLLSLIGK